MIRTPAATQSEHTPALRAASTRQTGIFGITGEASMQLVADILKSKPDSTVHTIGPATTVFDAIALMTEKRIGALVVVEGGSVVGIVTERDFTQKMVAKDRVSRKTAIREIMTAPVLHVRPDQTTEDCMVLMGANHLRHLPVMVDGQLVGMISIRDLVNDLIANL
jgi:CBS domain-containing protein